MRPLLVALALAAASPAAAGPAADPLKDSQSVGFCKAAIVYAMHMPDNLPDPKIPCFAETTRAISVAMGNSWGGKHLCRETRRGFLRFMLDYMDNEAPQLESFEFHAITAAQEFQRRFCI